MTKPFMRRPHTLFFAMQLAMSGALLTLSAPLLADDVQNKAQPQSPDVLLGPLFSDVQTAKLFPDQKTFADAVPKSDPLMVLADYRMQRNQSGFDLRHFVDVNFVVPGEGKKYVPPAGQSLREHIDDLWSVLTRTTDTAGKWDSLLPLPKPYVVPGGRFREVYYWDSYFTMLGLAESDRSSVQLRSRRSLIWWCMFVRPRHPRRQAPHCAWTAAWWMILFDVSQRCPTEHRWIYTG